MNTPIIIKLYMSPSCFYIMRKYKKSTQLNNSFYYDIRNYDESNKVISDFTEEYIKMRESYKKINESRNTLWNVNEIYYIAEL
jgi:hypothetical protein